MDIKNFVLTYYKNAADGFHIHRVEKSTEAQKPHTHMYFQIYYVIKGTLTHFVSGESSHLSRGDMSIIPPGTVHYINPEQDTVFYSFSFMPDSLGEPGQHNRLAINFLRSLQSDTDNYQIRPKITLPSDEIFYVEGIMEHILKEFTEKPFGHGETIRSYAILLITMFARSYFEARPGDMTSHFEDNRQFVLHCIQYIDHNFADKLSLEEIAKRSAMSKSCFCKLFYQITGHSFNNYLNMCRIKQATVYIRQGYKITGVYGLCGYSDFSTFYRNFRKFMGISPQTYKEQLQEISMCPQPTADSIPLSNHNI